jgi:hypothetical protein
LHAARAVAAGARAVARPVYATAAAVGARAERRKRRSEPFPQLVGGPLVEGDRRNLVGACHA